MAHDGKISFEESSRAKFRTVDDMMKLTKNEKLSFKPGAKYSYSNTGYLVLGAIIEKVTGKSYYDFIRKNIYQPAGMQNTDCFELDLVNSNLAVGYSKEKTEKGERFTNNIFDHVMRGGPAGGCYSTVEDLLKFEMALYSNKIISEKMRLFVMSPKPELNSPSYGYGFQIFDDVHAVGHTGGFKGITTSMKIYEKSGYVAIVLSNLFPSHPGPSNLIAEKISELVNR